MLRRSMGARYGPVSDIALQTITGRFGRRNWLRTDLAIGHGLT